MKKIDDIHGDKLCSLHCASLRGCVTCCSIFFKGCMLESPYSKEGILGFLSARFAGNYGTSFLYLIAGTVQMSLSQRERPSAMFASDSTLAT